MGQLLRGGGESIETRGATIERGGVAILCKLYVVMVME